MLIGSSNNFFHSSFDFGQAMVQTSIAAARPAFELQFFLTQDALLEKLNTEIDEINGAVNTKTATALLQVQISRLNNDLETINDYKSRTDAKAERITDTLDFLAELETLAAPGTVAEFDAKLADTITLLQKTNAPTYERYGVQDRLRKAKNDGLAQLEALVHNNFATQTDIDNAVAVINDIETDYLASQSIVNSNTTIAFNLQQNSIETVGELSRQVSNIKIDALDKATDEVKEKQDRFAQILTAISLSFEASQNITNFVAENVAFPQEIEPGSVLNLFS
ncbi:MAG: hypothetical protein GKS02_03680 [Alphaproteobacteria bacterium]|nr:hypothetical protein [Alphaproteobacteria bacterium]